MTKRLFITASELHSFAIMFAESWSWGITHRRTRSWRRDRCPKQNLHQVRTLLAYLHN